VEGWPIPEELRGRVTVETTLNWDGFAEGGQTLLFTVDGQPVEVRLSYGMNYPGTKYRVEGTRRVFHATGDEEEEPIRRAVVAAVLTRAKKLSTMAPQ
jgi:hypothetical protein